MSEERQLMQKSWPYRIAILLLYREDLRGVTHVNGCVNIILPALAAELGVPNNRLRLYLQELERLDIIRELQLARGFASCIIEEPPNIFKKVLDK